MEAQKAIAAKLVDLERHSQELLQEIRELKTQWNTHSPISQLPDEIFLEIFMAMTCFPVDKWLQVAHVCRRWRHVAAEAPMLWTHPPTYRHHLTMFMLERSKEANLTVYLDASIATQTAQAVLKCIGRIASLELGDDDVVDEVSKEFFLHQVLFPAFPQDASRLKSLKITSNADKSWNCQTMLRLLHPLNQLNKLLLTNVLLDWDVLPLNNLTHLYFRYVSLPTSISMQQFIETLRQMPLLEILGLCSSDNVLSPRPLPAMNEAMLTLSFLRRLDLRDIHPDHLVYFFAHSTFPQLRRLDIGIENPRGYNRFISNYHSTIVQAIASTVTNGSFGTFERAEFGPWSFRLSMLGKKDDSPDIKFHVPSDWEREEESIVPQIMIDISELCQPNFSKLLHLDMDDVPIEVEYMRLTTCLSYLHKLTIRSSNILPILTSVLAVPSHDPSELVGIPFPDLKSISCDCLRFIDSAALDAFTDCLMVRRQYGYPLHELAVVYCSSVTSTQITRLKEVVVNLKYAPT